ncbi:MAG: nitronate monooxygenase, partial [Flavobacteriales bacterium]|nr:nitronate monooxygenase [Flavobacteriales bacterium]
TKIFDAYKKGSTPEELKILLGRGRAKKGIFEGDLIEGELEIGQVSAQINEIKSVQEIMEELTEGFKRVKNNLNNFDY